MKNNFNHNQPSIFSSNGRFGRLSYLAWSGLTFLILIASLGLFKFFLMSEVIEVTKTLSLVLMCIFLIICLLIMYLNIIFMIKRLHDFDQTGWLFLLNFVPIINFLFTICLLVMPGSEKRNQYGAVRETPVWEKIFAFVGMAGIVAVFVFFPELFKV